MGNISSPQIISSLEWNLSSFNIFVTYLLHGLGVVILTDGEVFGPGPCPSVLLFSPSQGDRLYNVYHQGLFQVSDFGKLTLNWTPWCFHQNDFIV